MAFSSGTIGIKQVMRLTQLRKQEIIDLYMRGKFPAPLREISHAMIWFEDEIQDWICERLEEDCELSSQMSLF